MLTSLASLLYITHNLDKKGTNSCDSFVLNEKIVIDDGDRYRARFFYNKPLGPLASME